jgi:glycosyltransferase involved in cell wall biosynthesis
MSERLCPGEERGRLDVCAAVVSDLPFDARVWKQARSLAAGGYRLLLVGTAFDLERPHRIDDASGARALEIPLGCRDQTRSYRRRALALVRLWLEVLRTPARVYHCHDIHPAFAMWLAARLRKAKLVYDAHELWGDPLSRAPRELARALAGRLINRWMVRSADLVITTNPSRARVLSARYERNDVAVLANVPPLARNVAPLDPGFPAGARVVLYLGRIIAEHRAFHETVHALAMVERDIHLVIVGYGWEAARRLIAAWAGEAGVADRVHFLAPRPWRELPAIAAAATAGLVPLRRGHINDELGDTNKLHEYLMGGLPVIASDLPEIRRIVTMTDPPVGELFDAADPASIADAMRRLFAEPELLLARRRKARELAERHLNWEVEERKLLAHYSALLGGRR